MQTAAAAGSGAFTICTSNTMTVLDIALFATIDVNWPNCIDEYIAGARYHLGNYDIRLHLYPDRPANPTMLYLPLGPVHDRVPDHGIGVLAGDIRAACHVALPEGHGIPVIFCRFRRSSDAGLTVYTEDLPVNRGIRWLNYILVNAEQLNSNRAVLLHELIHAANYVGDVDPLWNRLIHDSDPASVMRRGQSALPVVMSDRHAAALRRAYFARQV